MTAASDRTPESLVTRTRDKARERHTWFSGTLVGRAVHRFNHFRGTRLAGTVTFYGFLSVFPILMLAFSVTLRVVGAEGVLRLEEFVEEYVPGIADQLGLERLRRSAASLQIVGAATLLVVGLGWVDATRASVRAMWGLPDKEGNLVVRKLRDLLAFFGLGVLVALSLLASTWVSGVGHWLLEQVGQEQSSAGRTASTLLAQLLASLTATAIVAYILAGLPQIRMPWKVLLPAALVGGVALEVLKRLLIGYVSGFAGNNAYGAFGVPIALLIWIYVIARLLMVIAAWTAERCGAPLVQPRFLEAAAAMRAAGDVEADREEAWEASQLALVAARREAAHAKAGRFDARMRGFVGGVAAGAALALLLRRRR